MIMLSSVYYKWNQINEKHATNEWVNGNDRQAWDGMLSKLQFLVSASIVNPGNSDFNIHLWIILHAFLSSNLKWDAI